LTVRKDRRMNPETLSDTSKQYFFEG